MNRKNTQVSNQISRSNVQLYSSWAFLLFRIMCIFANILSLSILSLTQHSDQIVCACVCAKLLQSCLALCDSMDCSPPGSYVHGILQAGILDWVAMPSSRASSQPRDQTCISYVSCIGRWVLYHQHHQLYWIFKFLEYLSNFY